MKSASAKSIKRWFRQFPTLVALKRATLPGPRSSLNVVEMLPLYVPASDGLYEDIAPVTIQTANSIFPFLVELLRTIGKQPVQVLAVENFPKNSFEIESAHALKSLLDAYGSDKATYHNYHYLYGPILTQRERVKNILEIGIGTNFGDVVSTMGMDGKPGASLRAFRDFLPGANILGGDIDKRILFHEDRINTYHVDQMDVDSLKRLARQIPEDLDLIIDDGLHAPAANIAVLSFAITKVRPGGWIVIEDIADKALPFWDVVAAILPADCKCQVVKIRGANAFVVERKPEMQSPSQLDFRGSDEISRARSGLTEMLIDGRDSRLAPPNDTDALAGTTDNRVGPLDGIDRFPPHAP